MAPSEVDVFITVERRDDILAYSCYRDEEVSLFLRLSFYLRRLINFQIWAACYEYHDDNIPGFGVMGYF
jgi:hypothetical protein